MEVANGVLHPVVALVMQRYVAGVLTAPLLLLVALRLAYILRQRSDREPDPKRV